jgi:hypothetical protein
MELYFTFEGRVLRIFIAVECFSELLRIKLKLRRPTAQKV